MHSTSSIAVLVCLSGVSPSRAFLLLCYFSRGQRNIHNLSSRASTDVGKRSSHSMWRWMMWSFSGAEFGKAYKAISTPCKIVLASPPFSLPWAHNVPAEVSLLLFFWLLPDKMILCRWGHSRYCTLLALCISSHCDTCSYAFRDPSGEEKAEGHKKWAVSCYEAKE